MSSVYPFIYDIMSLKIEEAIVCVPVLLFPLISVLSSSTGTKINFKQYANTCITVVLLEELYCRTKLRYLSRTPYINIRGRQGRGPSLWEGLWPQRIVGPAIGASGCCWLVRLARCLASLPSSRKTVVSQSRILEIPRKFDPTNVKHRPVGIRRILASISSLPRVCHRNSPTKIKLSDPTSRVFP